MPVVMLAISARQIQPQPVRETRPVARHHGLDEMRGLAALCVVLHHAESAFQMGHLFARGYLAVDFFFLLSGYLLGIAYEKRFADGLSAIGFMRLRIVRLWPVLAVGLALATLCLLLQGVAPRAALMLFVAQLAFMPVVSAGGGIFPLIGVQWSLWFELQANLLHGLALRHMRVPALISLVAICAIVLTILTLQFGKVAMGDMISNWWGGFARAGFSYGLGYLISRPACRQRLGHLSVPPSIAALIPAGLLFIIVGAALFAPALQAIADLMIVIVFFPLLLIASIASADARTGRHRSILGFLSYPLYAIHLPLIGYVAGQGLFNAPLLRFGTMIATVILTLVIAYLVACWLEPRSPSEPSRVFAHR